MSGTFRNSKDVNISCEATVTLRCGVFQLWTSTSFTDTGPGSRFASAWVAELKSEGVRVMALNASDLPIDIGEISNGN